MRCKQEEGDAGITKHRMCHSCSCTKTLCAGRVRYGSAVLVVEPVRERERESFYSLVVEPVNCSNADVDTECVASTVSASRSSAAKPKTLEHETLARVP